LVLAFGGVAHAVCPPQFLFGCSVSGSAAGPGLTVGNTTGDGLTGTSDRGTGVSGHSNSGAGVGARSETGSGVEAYSYAGVGVHGLSTLGVAVKGESAGANAIGVQGTAIAATAVVGDSLRGIGVYGVSTSGNGVRGESSQNDAVVGVSASNFHAGVVGGHIGSGNGIYGESTSGYAGYFAGNVRVYGTLEKGAGSFTIDHPLDPVNKTLSHSFVESPDMLNIYNGTTLTDAHGDATITLPAYFQALNREFRYQLTVIEQFAQAIVARKIQENQFMIKTDKPYVEVSWMVTGVRQDAYANAHRIVVEDEKPAHERGAYLYPEMYGQPKKTRVSQAQPVGEMQPMHAEAAPHHAAAQP